MAKRRAIWRPSDIQSWGSRDVGRPAKKPASIDAFGLDLDRIVRVRVGRDSWSTTLRWIADLLNTQEKVRLGKALAAKRAFSLPKRSGRAALMIEGEAEDGSARPLPEAASTP